MSAEVESSAIVCAECERPWTDPNERWRSYLTIDDEAALYCPECADAEFGS
jgi:hypothetical protein